jgi:aspartyl-tRNA(Asn)/glutamyl-tRNA(Gln) amidotransferase subunit C
MDSISMEANKPSIDIDTVRHIADLIRLKLEEEEAVLFTQQFSQIIDYFQILNEIDTRDVLPANEISPIRNIYRDDEEHSSMSRDEFLNNVPMNDGQLVIVPRTN